MQRRNDFLGGDARGFTLLEATGRKGDTGHNAGLEGVSLVPLLRDPRAKLGREALCFHYPHYYPTTTPVSAIRAGDWKLLHFYEDNHVELYNLKDDIGETKNLAKMMPDKARELGSRLHNWLKQGNAQMPRPNPVGRKSDT